MQDSTKVLSIARLSEKGQLTIPAEYRRDFALERESILLVMQVGGALVLVPHDAALTTVTERMEMAMRGANVSVDDLIEAATEVRSEIVAREFGDSLSDEAASQ